MMDGPSDGSGEEGGEVVPIDGDIKVCCLSVFIYIIHIILTMLVRLKIHSWCFPIGTLFDRLLLV